MRWARAHGQPVVGNGDVHRLRQLGTTYSLVEADRDPDAICEAILAGRLRVEARPLSWIAASTLVAELIGGSLVRPAVAPAPPAPEAISSC